MRRLERHDFVLEAALLRDAIQQGTCRNTLALIANCGQNNSAPKISHLC
jgi:hypothetical protein